MLTRLLSTLAAVALRALAQQDAQQTTNAPAQPASLVEVIATTATSKSTANPPAVSPAVFNCFACGDAFSTCGIDCLVPDLTWENIGRCQAVCKEKLCNGVIGQVSALSSGDKTKAVLMNVNSLVAQFVATASAKDGQKPLQ
jgi:hypothetical protein